MNPNFDGDSECENPGQSKVWIEISVEKKKVDEMQPNEEQRNFTKDFGFINMAYITPNKDQEDITEVKTYQKN